MLSYLGSRLFMWHSERIRLVRSTIRRLQRQTDRDHAYTSTCSVYIPSSGYINSAGRQKMIEVAITMTTNGPHQYIIITTPLHKQPQQVIPTDNYRQHLSSLRLCKQLTKFSNNVNMKQIFGLMQCNNK